jgi:mannan polymerase II complex MNN11 subunit
MVLGLCALATLLFTISRIFGSGESIPSGTPPVVIVTVVDESYSPSYIESIKENRIAYAKKHGEWHQSRDSGRLVANDINVQAMRPSSLH